MNTVAIYCRLSDEDKNKLSKGDDSESIQNQKMLLTEYAINQGWHIYKIYSDDDYSGLDKNRPQFSQMINEAQLGRFNIILCKHQSRFTRDMELVEKYLHNKFLEWGIRFVSVVDNVDTSVKGNKKARQIYGLINEWYCEDISDSIRAVFKSKMENGQFLGSFACFGYIKDPEDRHKLIIDPKAAETVKLIYELYISGFGTHQIRLKLNEMGVLTPTQYKKEQGSTYRNCNNNQYGRWNHGTIIKILRNQTYIGSLVQGMETKASYKSTKRITRPRDQWIVIENSHEPIIDKEAFYTVQKIMDSSRRDSKVERRAHIFASKVKCLECGSTMMKYVTGQCEEGYKYVYLRCKRSMITKRTECTIHTTRLELLVQVVEDRVRDVIRAFLNNDKKCAEVRALLEDGTCFESKIEQKKKELERLEGKHREYGEILRNLYTDKVRGVITEEHYLELYDNFLKESDGYKQKKQLVAQEIEYILGKSKSYYGWHDAIERFKAFKSLTHEMVNLLIDYIEIGETNENGEQEVRVHWQF